MARVHVRHGTEGPRHDPYSYTEVTFIRTDGLRITMRSGLGTSMRIGRIQLNFRREETYFDVFRSVTGMEFDEAAEIPHILERRMLRRMKPQQRLEYEMCMEVDADMLANAY